MESLPVSLSLSSVNISQNATGKSSTQDEFANLYSYDSGPASPEVKKKSRKRTTSGLDKSKKKQNTKKISSFFSKISLSQPTTRHAQEEHIYLEKSETLDKIYSYDSEGSQLTLTPKHSQSNSQNIIRLKDQVRLKSNPLKLKSKSRLPSSSLNSDSDEEVASKSKPSKKQKGSEVANGERVRRNRLRRIQPMNQEKAERTEANIEEEKEEENQEISNSELNEGEAENLSMEIEEGYEDQEDGARNCGEIEGEQEGDQEEEEEEEERSRTYCEDEQESTQPESALSPVHISDNLYEIDPEAFHFETSCLKFEEHCDCPATPFLFRIARLAQISLFNQIRADLPKWLALFVDDLKLLEKEIIPYRHLKVFQNILSWSHFFSFKFRGAANPKCTQINLKILMNYLSQPIDFGFTEESLRTDLIIQLIMKDHEINAYLKFSKNSRAYFKSCFFTLACSKLSDKPTDTNEIYLAFNTSEPSSQYIREDILVNKKSLERNYNVKEDGSFKTFPHHDAELFAAMRVHGFLALRKHLLEDCGLEPADLLFDPFLIDYRTSSNPIFWPFIILMNEFNCPLNSFQFKFAEKCEAESLPFFSQNNLQPTRQEFLLKLAQELLAYSSQFQQNKESGIKLYRGRNFSKQDRVHSVRKKLSNIELPKVEDMRNWIPSEERQAELQKLREKYKPDVQELLIEPLFHKLIRGETSLQEILKYIDEMAVEENERGETIRKFYVKIMSDLRRAAAIHEEIKNEEEVKWKTRREVLGEFLYGFLLKGKCIKKEIDELLLHPQYDEMLQATEDYILFSLGTDFIVHFQDVILRFDDFTSDTKQGGFFCRGKPSYGKSFFVKIAFLPFHAFKISNSNNNSVDPRLLEQCKTEKTKAITVRCHFYNLDEFNASKFNSHNTLSTDEFNELFNTSKEYHTLKMKHYTLYLKGNSTVFLCTHHSLEDFQLKFDRSFGSRFAVIIDFDEPVIFENKPGFPCREDGETDGQYFERLKRGKFAADKPLFPLSCNSAETTKLDSSKMSQVLFSSKLNIPKEDNIKSQIKQVKSRSQILKENYLSSDWALFNNITEVQASFIFHTVLVRQFDKLWPSLNYEQREARFPLQEERSLRPENVEIHGTKYTHDDFKPTALLPSVLLKYYSLLEAPQGLVKQLIQDDPTCLAG